MMEEDILNYLPTVIFRGTPCSTNKLKLLATYLSHFGACV